MCNAEVSRSTGAQITDHASPNVAGVPNISCSRSVSRNGLTLNRGAQKCQSLKPTRQNRKKPGRNGTWHKEKTLIFRKNQVYPRVRSAARGTGPAGPLGSLWLLLSSGPFQRTPVISTLWPALLYFVCRRIVINMNTVAQNPVMSYSLNRLSAVNRRRQGHAA